MAKVAVLVFPGSNCDHDVYHATKHVLGQDARFVWHKEGSIGDADVSLAPMWMNVAKVCESASSGKETGGAAARTCLQERSGGAAGARWPPRCEVEEDRVCAPGRSGCLRCYLPPVLLQIAVPILLHNARRIPPALGQ